MSRVKRNSEVKVRKPLIRIERVVYERATFKVSRDVLTNLEQYVLYLKEVTGDTPTPDEIVDRGMQRLFGSDRGFRHWLQKRVVQSGSVIKAEKSSEMVKQISAKVVTETHQKGQLN